MSRSAEWVFLGLEPAIPLRHLRAQGVKLSQAEKDRMRSRYTITRRKLGWTHETVGLVFGYVVQTCQRWVCWYSPPEPVVMILEAIASDAVTASVITRLVLQSDMRAGVVVGSGRRRLRRGVKRKLIPGRLVGKRKGPG